MDRRLRGPSAALFGGNGRRCLTQREIALSPGDRVFDPFGKDGTTYVAVELNTRRWIGVEIGPVQAIVDRFARIEEERQFLQAIRAGCNVLFTEKIRQKRLARG